MDTPPPKNAPAAGLAPLIEAHRQLRGQFARTGGAKARYELILGLPEAAQLVPALPAEDLYFTIKELGLADAPELVQLASSEQFRTFVDLDVWQGEQISASRMLAWLHAARADQDETRYQRKLKDLDLELVELLLKGSLRIWDLVEEPDPELESDRIFRSPEGHFLVEFLVEGVDYLGLKGVLDTLYAQDPFQAARLLSAVRWESTADLEEQALRWRNGRLGDLGFPDLEEAQSYYAWRDPDAALPALVRPPPLPGAFPLARLAPGGRFFDRAAAAVDEADREVVERQLAGVFNAALVADAVDTGDLEAVGRTLTAARDTLSLGLEHVSRGEVALGAKLLASAPLKRIFQVGVSLALRLKYRADRLMRGGSASWPERPAAPLFDSPLSEAVAAVRRRRPLLCEALVQADLSPERLRPFRDLSDVALVDAAMGRAERTAELFQRLGFSPAAAAPAFARGEGLAFSDLLLGAVARELLGLGFCFEPVPAARVAALAGLGFCRVGDQLEVAGPFAAALRQRLDGVVAGLSEAHRQTAEELAERCLARWREEAGGVLAASGGLDPAMPLPFAVG